MVKVLFLCAGLGSRLRPHTDTVPKAMVGLLGKPMLCRQLSVVNEYINSENIGIVAGYKAECFTGLSDNIFYNEDYDKTNMVHSLFKAESFMDDDLIICYGDIVYDDRVFKSILESDKDFSVVIDTKFEKLWNVRSDEPLSDTESLILDDNGAVLELGKKVKSMDEPDGQYIGLIKISKQYMADFINHFNTLKKQSNDSVEFRNMYMTDFIQSFIDSGKKVFSVPIESGWLEVDTVEDLAIYTKLYEQGKLNEFLDICEVV